MPTNKGSVEQKPGPNQGDGSERPQSPDTSLAPQNARHLRIVHTANAHQVVSSPMQTSSPGSPSRPPPPGKNRGLLDRSVQAQIGRMLRDVFSDVAKEPVPERFVKLLEALHAEEKRR